MRKTFLAVFSIMFAFLLGACTSEKITPDKTQKNEAPTLRFAFGVPVSEPVTYSDFIHESDEYALTRLDIFEFDASGNFYDAFLNQPLQNAMTVDHPSRKLVAEISLKEGTLGNHTFLFVANQGDWMDQELTSPVTENLQDFKKRLTKALADNGKIRPDFLMTGEKQLNIVDSSPIDLTQTESETVWLTRNIARIDVGIRLQDNAKEKLEIKEVKALNMASATTLYPQSGNVSPTASTSVSYEIINSASSPALSTYFDDVAGEVYDTRYKKLFYVYERNKNEFEDKGVPTIIIKADYTPYIGAPAIEMEYKVPFDRSIVRNNLYNIILGVNKDKDQYVGVANLKVMQWNKANIVYFTTRIFDLKKNDELGDAFEFDYIKHDLTLKDGQAVNLEKAILIKTMMYSDNSTQVVKENKAYLDPITGKKIAPNNDWIEPKIQEYNGQYYLNIKVKENTDGSERSGIIWLKHNQDSDLKHTYALRIVQPA